MLRRHINPLESPLYRLPPDLFPEIAFHLASETDLVHATHVSYHLRNTLLSHPRLWSHLNFEHEARARAFFGRSGQAPLHVDASRDSSRTVASLAELRQQSKRIVTLKLRHWAVQKRFLSEPLPSLKRLEIYHYFFESDDWDEKRDVNWAPVWGPIKKATSWSFPSLTSLMVCNLDPIPFWTPHLTRFKFLAELGTINISQLADFLVNCPLLEHIDIFYANVSQNEHNHVISLPSLRTYTESTFNEVCSLTILNTLSLPPFCSVMLKSRSYSRTAAEVDDILPRFDNPVYLSEIRRVKLRTIYGPDGREVAGTLELINSGGMRVRSERVHFEEEELEVVKEEAETRICNMAHLNLMSSLNGRLVETLCIDGCASQDEVVVEFLKEVLSFGSVRTLILSHGAAWPCLSALDEDPSAGNHGQWFLPIHTLIIHLGPDQNPFLFDNLLLSIAQKRKAAGFPLRTVSLFRDLGWVWYQALPEELRGCIEDLEVVIGDGALDWDVDKYFLDGFDHLQRNRDVRWD